MAIISLFEEAGIKVTKQGPVRDVFKETGLDWEVTQHPVSSDYGIIPKVKANYRSDNNQFLGFVHPKTYKIVQNIEAFDFIDKLDNFTFDKVGTFNGGKKVFVVGKANDQIDIDGNGDFVDFYLTFLHGHDGKSGIRFILSPIRMFCMNQMNLMLNSATFKYNIAHTGNIDMKLKAIHRAINHSKNYVIDLTTTINNMINTKPILSINEFVETLIPTIEDDSEVVTDRKKIVKAEIINLYKYKDDLQNYKDTQFGYISAVSDYISHQMPLRNSNSQATINNTFIRNLEGNELLEKANSILLAA